MRQSLHLQHIVVHKHCFFSAKCDVHTSKQCVCPLLDMRAVKPLPVQTVSDLTVNGN